MMMRVRVRGLADKFFLESSYLGLWWRRLPSIDHWVKWPGLRRHHEYVSYYSKYEDAKRVAADYLKLTLVEIALDEPQASEVPDTKPLVRTHLPYESSMLGPGWLRCVGCGHDSAIPEEEGWSCLNPSCLLKRAKS